jgi:nucleotide-binding universal stress UspA family protein
MADRLIVVGVDGTTTGLRAVAWADRTPAGARHAAVRAVLGSVSRFVLHHSLVPITVVPRSLSRGDTVPAADPHDRSQLW